ncbi:MAG: hypothetical protein K6T30_04940, partial [Alicyclobacillus sp.]|nr:hypothetical protein [Alicyclobacillus sp.]
YDQAAKIAKYALENRLSLPQAAQALGVPADAVARALDVERLARTVPRTVEEAIQAAAPAGGLAAAPEAGD